MTMTEIYYEVIADISDNPNETKYARVECNRRIKWKTKRIAEKHAREYKATHMCDAWVEIE